MRATSSIHVMIVEDFDSFRRFVCSKIETGASCGSSHLSVSDGLEAVHKALDLRPKLILLDIPS